MTIVKLAWYIFISISCVLIKVSIHVFYSVRRWKRWWFNIKTIIPNLRGVPLSKQNMAIKSQIIFLRRISNAQRLKQVYLYYDEDILYISGTISEFDKNNHLFSSWRRGKICICTLRADDRIIKRIHNVHSWRVLFLQVFHTS